jgi:hypothetical protein
MWFKKNWPALLAVALQAESLWKFLKWALDWRGRYDGLAATYHEIGGGSAMIGYILDPPPWFYPLAFFVGLILIWWNFHRNREPIIGGDQANLQGVVGDQSLSSIIESPPTPSETIASPNHRWQFDSQMAVEIAARLRNRPEWQDKIIIDVTPEYLWDLFRRGRTSMEGSIFSERFINKWMVVCGPFGDVSVLRETTLVTFAFRNSAELVFMYFNENWRERLGIIIQDKKIAVAGRIFRVRNNDLQLDDCEIVQ